MGHRYQPRAIEKSPIFTAGWDHINESWEGSGHMEQTELSDRPGKPVCEVPESCPSPMSVKQVAGEVTESVRLIAMLPVPNFLSAGSLIGSINPSPRSLLPWSLGVEHPCDVWASSPELREAHGIIHGEAGWRRSAGRSWRSDTDSFLHGTERSWGMGTGGLERASGQILPAICARWVCI